MDMKDALFLFLFISAVLDIKRRRISLLLVFLFAVIWIVSVFRNDAQAFITGTIGMIPGIVLAAISILSGEKIGMGDAITVTLCGVYLGVYPVLMLLMISFILTTMVGVILIFLHKAKRDSYLPFVPFLAIAYGVIRSLGGI